jgi:hypothetical protein
MSSPSGGLGFVAVTLGGIAAHHWNKAFGATATGAEQLQTPAER